MTNRNGVIQKDSRTERKENYCTDDFGDGVGEGEADDAGFDLSTLLTSFGSSNATTPLLRYQIPSLVCHASSASIVLPLCKVIMTGPLFSLRLAAVEIALELNSIRG
jgi:hypothetical protein